MTPEAQKEREAVVAWLREIAANGEPFNLDPMSSLGLPLDMAAAAIERGDHITLASPDKTD